MRTKRGGFKWSKNRAGTPRVKLTGSTEGGGDFYVALSDSKRLTNEQRLAAIYGRVVNWRQFGDRRPIEPLDAGLKRYLRFPLYAKT